MHVRGLSDHDYLGAAPARALDAESSGDYELPFPYDEDNDGYDFDVEDEADLEDPDYIM